MKPNVRRRPRIIVVVWGLMTLAVYFGGGQLVAPFLRSRLAHMVAGHLNAELRMSGLRYHFPYGVTVSDASLVTREGDTELELFKAKRVDLVLDQLPTRTGPLVIKKLTLTQPVVNVVRDAAGTIAGHDLGRRDKIKHPAEGADVKLSDVFRLRRLVIDGGRVAFTDASKPGAHEVVWDGIGVSLKVEPQSGSLYAFDVVAENKPLAAAELEGTFDVDALLLHLKKADLDIDVKRDGQNEQLPAAVQQFLRSDPVAGHLKVHGSLDIPFHQPGLAKYQAMLDLTDANASIPQWQATVDKLAFGVRVSSEPFPVDGQVPTTRPASPTLFARLTRLDASTGDTSAQIEKAFAEISAASGWRVRNVLGTLTVGRDRDAFPDRLRHCLDDLAATGTIRFTARAEGRPGKPTDYKALATLRDVTVHPPGFPMALDKVGGTIGVKPELITIEALEGLYGGDHVLVATARIPLDGLARSVRIQELSGTVDFGEGQQRYPRALDDALRILHPKGAVAVTANVLVPTTNPSMAGYRVGLSGDSLALDVAVGDTGHRLPMSQVKVDLVVDGVGRGAAVQATRCEATAFGGKVSGTGQLRAKKPLDYAGELHIGSIDMPGLYKALGLPERHAGRIFADVGVTGSAPHDGKGMLDWLTAKGDVEVLEGDFYEVPLLRALIASVKLPRNAAVIGQVAGSFTIRDRRVDFEPAAVSSPALGLQGFGTVDFDGVLNLSVVAAPLADWKDAMKRTGIPVVSDVTGEIAGGIQKLLNGATRAVLYEFRVTGNVQDPVIQTVAAPGLRDGAAKLFGKMMSAKPDDKLIDAVKAK